MKIALNAEFRYNIFGAFNGAFFADCGNSTDFICSILSTIYDKKQVGPFAIV